ncbi:hypothetical protein GOODEAATRI_030022, partial [Goodea atripinnis]
CFPFSPRGHNKISCSNICHCHVLHRMSIEKQILSYTHCISTSSLPIKSDVNQWNVQS